MKGGIDLSCIYSEEEFHKKQQERRKQIDYVDYLDLIRGHNVQYVEVKTSSSHTFGNITAYIQNWIINLFPENTFKTIHVNSKIAHQQMRSTPHEFLKKMPPMFIIRPRIDWNESNKFLNNTPLIERKGYMINIYGKDAMQDFFQDDIRKIAIKYLLNREVMNFDIVLIFQTLEQQINYASYLKNRLPIDEPFTLETCLENYLPKELLQMLSDLSGIPILDEENSNQYFLRYLNGNSICPITYKLQGATGNEEYFRYYPAKIDTILNNFSIDDGTQVGHVSDRFTISFTLRCEFYTTGFYYIFSDKIRDHHKVWVNNKYDSTLVPIFTDVLTRDDINLPLGWKLYASPSCRLENENDEIDLSSLFNKSIKTCLKFNIDRGIPPVEFFKIRVRKQGKIIEEGRHYKFDFHNYHLKFINCNTYYTYKILIMLNIEYINNMIKNVYNLE